MIKFLFACLALACTLLGFGLFGLVVWGAASLLELFFAVFPVIGVGIAAVICFGYVIFLLWGLCKILWIFASSFYETLCEKYIKK